jgi:hypothetical protein
MVLFKKLETLEDRKDGNNESKKKNILQLTCVP